MLANRLASDCNGSGLVRVRAGRDAPCNLIWICRPSAGRKMHCALSEKLKVSGTRPPPDRSLDGSKMRSLWRSSWAMICFSGGIRCRSLRALPSIATSRRSRILTIWSPISAAVRVVRFIIPRLYRARGGPGRCRLWRALVRAVVRRSHPASRLSRRSAPQLCGHAEAVTAPHGPAYQPSRHQRRRLGQ